MVKDFSKENQVISEALAAASAATAKHLADNPGVWYPCGFAWVKIRPARGRLVEVMKARDVGDTDTYEGGFRVYNPSNNVTQWMDAKEEGCKAFVAVLKKYYPEIKASVQTRMD